MAEPLLSFFLSAASALGRLTTWFVGREKEDRERIAAYFDEIAACLKEVAERIEAGEAPRDTCRRLAVFAGEIEAILKDRGYVTATGDASIDETRMRLAGELVKAKALWDTGSIADVEAKELAADDLVRVINVAAISQGEPAETTLDRIAGEVTQRAHAVRPDAQPVWDAAGEFAGLAATIRAR